MDQNKTVEAYRKQGMKSVLNEDEKVLFGCSKPKPLYEGLSDLVFTHKQKTINTSARKVAACFHVH